MVASSARSCCMHALWSTCFHRRQKKYSIMRSVHVLMSLADSIMRSDHVLKSLADLKLLGMCFCILV